MFMLWIARSSLEASGLVLAVSQFETFSYRQPQICKGVAFRAIGCGSGVHISLLHPVMSLSCLLSRPLPGHHDARVQGRASVEHM